MLERRIDIIKGIVGSRPAAEGSDSIGLFVIAAAGGTVGSVARHHSGRQLTSHDVASDVKGTFPGRSGCFVYDCGGPCSLVERDEEAAVAVVLQRLILQH
jgi:hypothetical protein